MSYKLTQNNSIQRLSDGATFPAKWENGKLVELDEHSPFVKDLREWVDKSNVPQPADPKPALVKQLSTDGLAELLMAEFPLVITQAKIDAVKK